MSARLLKIREALQCVIGSLECVLEEHNRKGDKLGVINMGLGGLMELDKLIKNRKKSESYPDYNKYLVLRKTHTNGKGDQVSYQLYNDLGQAKTEAKRLEGKTEKEFYVVKIKYGTKAGSHDAKI